MFGFASYAIGILLFHAGFDALGILALLGGVYLHFKWWAVGVVSFLVGLNIR